MGKTWLACALAQAACRDGITVLYKRMPRLFDELELAHGDGRFPRLFKNLTKTQLLILDDWGPDRLDASQRRDLMEIVEDRYDAGSTLITSQLPIDAWHDVIGEPTFADAILDRLVHNAYRIELDVSVRWLHFRAVIPRHQLVWPVNFMVGDTLQNPSEPCLWINAVEFGGFDQSEGDGHGVSTTL